MKITKFTGIVGAVALALSGNASAVLIGGLNIPAGADFQVASVYERIVNGNGQVLTGVGEVTQINGASVNTLCAGCELTYSFGGFTSGHFASGAVSSVDFTGGWINFYLGFAANNDFNPFVSANSAADLIAATNGTLFLTLAGHTTNQGLINSVLFASGANFGTGTDTGTGTGLLDVDSTGAKNGNTVGAGAIANSFFDTNSINANLGGNADFQLGTSFGNAVVPHPAECPGGAECLAGSADLRSLVQAVPEPATMALLGLGLLSMGVTMRRRKV